MKGIPAFAYVGCFSAGKGEGHGEGISVYRVDPSTGQWMLVDVFKTLASPGFLVLDRSGKFLYSGHGNGSEISAYAIDRASGKLKLLNRQPTGGENGLHLDVHPDNRYLALANGPGMAIFPINPDGSLGAYVDSNKFDGAYHHMVLFDASGRYLVATDHGSHKVHVLPFDAATGKLQKNHHVFVDRRSAGPRHIAFHPSQRWAYDVNRSSTVTAYSWDAQTGQLKTMQVIRTVPDTFKGQSGASEVAIPPSGKFVYVSSRGADLIAIFPVDPNTGMLKAPAFEPIQGKHPRFFALDADGSHLYSAALESDRIVIFKINNDTGQLTATGQVVETPSPTCIAFAY